jgi:hypothetical protein
MKQSRRCSRAQLRSGDDPASFLDGRPGLFDVFRWKHHAAKRVVHQDGGNAPIRYPAATVLANTSRKAFSAALYQNERSIATPRAKSACTPELQELEKLTFPTLSPTSWPACS